MAAPTAPVVDIVAPVLDISFGDADLKRGAKVEQLPRRTTVTLDSTVVFGKDGAAIRSGARARSRSAATPTTSARPHTD